MVLPSTNIDGYRLVIAILNTTEFYHFPFPKTSKDLQQIDDFLLTKANSIEYWYEDLNQGSDIQLNNYSEFEAIKDIGRNAQGLTLGVKLGNHAMDNNPWRCLNCYSTNDAISFKCKTCSKPRIFKGGKRKFEI